MQVLQEFEFVGGDLRIELKITRAVLADEHFMPLTVGALDLKRGHPRRNTAFKPPRSQQPALRIKFVKHLFKFLNFLCF